MPIRELQIDRRAFVKNGTLAGVAAAYPSLFRVGKGRKKPNILLIMSDEHNPRVTGCYGDQIVKTPNIDSLAAQGVTFDNHYCNSPLCVPSRFSFTAGKYASRVDVWGLTSELPSNDMPSIARMMTAAGYQPYLCGKMHYQESRRYGFIQTGGDFNRYPKSGRGVRLTPADIKEHTPLGQRFKNFHTGEHGGSVEHDRRVTAGALEFLSTRNSDTPFFLVVGYLTPHFPLIVPEPFYTPYKDRVPMAELPAGLVANLPTNYKLQRAGFEETDVPDPTVKMGRELYYGLTTWMDNEVGKVLKALRANPHIAGDTVIIYTTDHGENMSEHGLWWKNCMYDHAARVPLVVSWPERWKSGQRRALTSSHLDLVKTVIDIAGGHPPGDWNGDSLVPWLDDPNHKWKDVACTEYYAQFIAHGIVMIRTGKWKYVYHGRPAEDMAVERELFDMETDPREFNNLANDPKHSHLIATLHARMVKEVGGDPEVTEQRSRRQLAVGYPGVNQAGDNDKDG
ncbi:MAG TPA: sulfatase-like hydrolase/transferase [Candidatus Sulfotelmatobacter sp.]|nr:sulfatase-like hydrolase/transferase [Candidatus Sulfotelmatobacter sp.]